jgi:hypothetical protein
LEEKWIHDKERLEIERKAKELHEKKLHEGEGKQQK